MIVMGIWEKLCNVLSSRVTCEGKVAQSTRSGWAGNEAYCIIFSPSISHSFIWCVVLDIDVSDPHIIAWHILGFFVVFIHAFKNTSLENVVTSFLGRF